MASGFLTLLFILTTYDISARNNGSDPLWFFELIIVLDLCLDWLLFLILDDNRLAYLFKFQSFISYITISSSFFCLFSIDTAAIDTYELKFMKVLRVLSLGRLEELFKRRNMPLGRALFRLIFESISIILIFASGMLRIENRYDR